MGLPYHRFVRPRHYCSFAHNHRHSLVVCKSSPTFDPTHLQAGTQTEISDTKSRFLDLKQSRRRKKYIMQMCFALNLNIALLLFGLTANGFILSTGTVWDPITDSVTEYTDVTTIATFEFVRWTTKGRTSDTNYFVQSYKNKNSIKGMHCDSTSSILANA